MPLVGFPDLKAEDDEEEGNVDECIIPLFPLVLMPPFHCMLRSHFA